MNAGPPWPQALLEVCLCSGYPTQLAVAGVLALAGIRAGGGGQFSLSLLVYLTAIDTVLLVGLVLALLISGGESPRSVLLGPRRILPEVLRGFGVLFWVFLVFVVTALTLLRVAPGLFTPNPMATLASTRAEFILFGATAMLAGVREEIQRAFILHRCEQRLGGALVGVIGFGLLFGLGHVLQGWSAVIITAMLGTLWSLVYLARRSVVAPITSHASFNLIEVVGFGLQA